MASHINEIAIDCQDAPLLAEFWAAVLGWVAIDSGEGYVEIAPAHVDDATLLAAIRSGPVVPSLFFSEEGGPKVGKNRLHLDLSPVDCSHDEEVERVITLGATRTDIGQTGEESWTVLADPEGNEFCVLRSLAEGHFSL